MIDNVAIITDSIANLTAKMVEQYKIGIVPIMLLIQGKPLQRRSGYNSVRSL